MGQLDRVAQRCAIVLLTSALTLTLFLRAAASNVHLSYAVLEHSPPNVILGDVILDSGLAILDDEHDVLRARILRSAYDVYFTVDSGLLETTHVAIDRESLCAGQVTCHVTLDVLVMTSSTQLVLKVKVEVLDINDNAPQFPQHHVDMSISEMAAKGTVFFLPAASDVDSPSNSVRRYTLQQQEADGLKIFDLQAAPMNADQSEIGLILLDALDYEKCRQYNITITAYDVREAYDVMTVHVTVIDENDNPPQFRGKNYAVAVREDTPASTIIAQVAAQDADDGVNGDVIFSLSPSSLASHGHVFGVERDTGALYLRSPLDYEQVTTYVINIQASDRGSVPLTSQTRFVVYVLDVNDNAPSIAVTDATGDERAEMMENSPPGTAIAVISVGDLDSGDAGQVSCRVEGDSSESVALRQTTFANLLKLTSRRSVDREVDGDSLNVHIVCTDSGVPVLTTRRNLTVTIRDENDNAPVFATQTVYSAIVEENNPIGVELLRVRATDRDMGANGHVTYHVDVSIATLVDVTEDGRITAVTSFDRETAGPQVTFYVYAVDRGQPPLSASVLVTLTLLDVDDEPPRFLAQSYFFTVDENLPPGTPVGRVMTQDGDTKGGSDVISYTILDSSNNSRRAFTINEHSGQLVTTMSLDRELQSSYTFVVLACNYVMPDLCSSINVTVVVADQNDNAPVIMTSSNDVSISCNASLGYVVTQISATDCDTNDNARLTYSIMAGNASDLFDINRLKGYVFVQKKLTPFCGAVPLELVIRVSDNGSPPLASFLRLYVRTDSSMHFKSRDLVAPIAAPKTFQLKGNELAVVAFCAGVVLAVTLAVGLLVISLIWCKRKRRKVVKQPSSGVVETTIDGESTPCSHGEMTVAFSMPVKKTSLYSINRNRDYLQHTQHPHLHYQQQQTVYGSLLPDITQVTGDSGQNGEDDSERVWLPLGRTLSQGSVVPSHWNR